MHTHANRPTAGWSWLMQAVNLGRRNPRAVFGAVALLALLALAPSVLQVVLQAGFGLGATGTLVLMAASTLVMVVLYPLLIGGVLRVIDAAEHGRPTHAMALFDAFRPGQGRGRLVGFGVAMFAAYLALAVVAAGLAGEEFFAWYMQLLDAGVRNDAAAQTRLLQTAPEGLGTLMALGTLVGLFFAGVYAIGFGQVALGGRSVGGALADGVAGTLKNLLPILLLAAVVFAGFLAFALALALVAAMLAAVGGAVHPLLAALLVAPVYLAALLVMYVVLFGVMYYMWRDVCGGEPPPPPPGHVAF